MEEAKYVLSEDADAVGDTDPVGDADGELIFVVCVVAIHILVSKDKITINVMDTAYNKNLLATSGMENEPKRFVIVTL